MSTMSENEFMLLDELYFVVSFDELQQALDFDNEELFTTLLSANDKGWIRVYEGIDNELDSHEIDLQNRFDKYHYLASKEGLMAHNSR